MSEIILKELLNDAKIKIETEELNKKNSLRNLNCLRMDLIKRKYEHKTDLFNYKNTIFIKNLSTDINIIKNFYYRDIEMFNLNIKNEKISLKKISKELKLAKIQHKKIQDKILSK